MAGMGRCGCVWPHDLLIDHHHHHQQIISSNFIKAKIYGLSAVIIAIYDSKTAIWFMIAGTA
jgi:hypothetical protein